MSSGKYPHFLHNCATFIGYPLRMNEARDRRRTQIRYLVALIVLVTAVGLALVLFT